MEMEKPVSTEPLEVEVFAHILGSMNHCDHCQVFLDGVGIGEQIHMADLDAYPPDWMDEWQHLSDLILSLAERFAGRLVIKITDAQSPRALWMSLAHGIRKYPTFVIHGEKYNGINEEEVASLINRHLVKPAT